MQTCKDCQRQLPETEFWDRRKDCKDCARAKARISRAAAKERMAAKKDLSLHEYGKPGGVPEGWELFKNTQQLDADGNVTRQWVRAKDRGGGPTLQEMVDTLHGIFEDNPKANRFPRVKTPKGRRREDLKGVAPVGDGHIGLLTWKGETGESYDLKMAARLYAEALARTIEASAAAGCESFLLMALGDWIHVDGPKNTTTRGTPQSVDGRWPKILETSIRLLINATVLALETHKKVEVSVVAGNHDEDITVAVRVALALYFENNPRVEVNQAHGRFHYYKFGQCLLASTHGDMAKPESLPGVMATDCAEWWGTTRFRHWYTGHEHHARVLSGKMSPDMQDHVGATVETMRVLVPSCGWAHAKGYRSPRDIRLDVWDANHGRIQTNSFGITLLREKMDL